MGLDLIPVLVGTLPVFVLILPTMLLGSFTYMAGLRTEDGELEFGFASVLATVFAAVTSLVMMAAMILAAYHLEQTISNRADEIDAIEIDKEVADLEAAEVAFNKAYTKVTEWERVPTVAKLVLYLAFVCLVTSCYMIQFFGGRCFADYQLTYTIDDHLDGNWLNLVLPLGWIAILIFVLGSFLLYGFVSWANVSSIVPLTRATYCITATSLNIIWRDSLRFSLATPAKPNLLVESKARIGIVSHNR